MSMLARSAEPTAPLFDYASLPSDVADRQRSRAERIVSIQRATYDAFVETGRILIEAQAELETGQFLKWIDHETGLSKSTAYRAINVAQHVAPRISTVGNLQLTVIQKIADAPADTRDQIVSALARGEDLPKSQIEGMIRSARTDAKLAKGKEDKSKRRARERENLKRHVRAMAKKIFEQAAIDLEVSKREHEAAVKLVALLGDKRSEAIDLMRRAGCVRDLESKAREPRLTDAVAKKIKGTRLDVDVYRQAIAFLEWDRQGWRVDSDLRTVERDEGAE